MDVLRVLRASLVLLAHGPGLLLVRQLQWHACKAPLDLTAAPLLLQAVFEIGRRYKIQNPDKMRSEYGKLMYMLMDSSDRSVQVSKLYSFSM